MTKKIFHAILLVASLILAACFLIILGVLYEHFADLQSKQLRLQTELIARGVSSEGLSYIKGLAAGDYRITWIQADGQVLYDTSSDSSRMENHADRREFLDAKETGYGQSARYSATLTEKMLYFAQRLPDGSVIRIASAQSTVLSLVLSMLQPICIVLAAAIILSALLASRLSRRIVRPLNDLDLDRPLENEAYAEIAPLLRRIDYQHRQIAAQMDALKQKQEEWNAVTDSMAEGILLLNAQRNILSLNRSAARILGTDESCIGTDILRLNRAFALQKSLEKAAHGEHAEAVMQLGEGEYQLEVSPVISDGQIGGVVLLLLDVADKANAEQMRREFTANVSHELKTPLHSISGCAEIMRDGLVKEEDMPRFIEQIYNESRRMITLIDDIIRLSKLDEGLAEMRMQSVDLMEIVLETVSLLQAAADKKGVAFKVTGDEGKIGGVPALLREIVYNLCDNAVKYNRENGSVELSVQDGQDGVTLCVRDTGIGIPEEHQERVFERFYRVDKSHSKEIGGTGLGLSIVKHAAALHHAQLTLESSMGKGTAISVHFPKSLPSQNA